MSAINIPDTMSLNSADSRTAETSSSDYRALVARCMGNLEFAERILAKFQRAFEHDLAELEEAFRAGDEAEMTRVAHRMKGASANASAGRLEQAAAEIERLGRSGRCPEVPPRLEDLRREWSRYLDCVRSPASEAAAP